MLLLVKWINLSEALRQNVCIVFEREDGGHSRQKEREVQEVRILFLWLVQNVKVAFEVEEVKKANITECIWSTSLIQVLCLSSKSTLVLFKDGIVLQSLFMVGMGTLLFPVTILLKTFSLKEKIWKDGIKSETTERMSSK